MYFYILLLNLLDSGATRLEALRTRDDRGATAVEYGLLVALIAAVIIAVVTLLGDKIKIAFSSITNKI